MTRRFSGRAVPYARRSSVGLMIGIVMSTPSAALASENENSPEGEPPQDSAPAPEQPGAGAGEGPREDEALEGSEGEAPALPNGVEMPSIVEAPAPSYPHLPEAERVSASVALVLSLDAEGRVTAVEVVEAAGAAFDEEAMRVASLYRFTPATRDGVAIASRIGIRVAFTPPESPVAELQVEGNGAIGALDPPASKAPASAPETEQEVQVLGQQSEKDRLAQSSDSVTLIDLEEQKQRSSSMGEVLARHPGLVIRQTGGVGTDSRVSLNGLYDRSVREFVDSVPLWMTPFPDDVSALPVNLFDRVEVYRGVVPLRLAADALGGAINFVTDRTYENHISGSLQVGSFGTIRGTALLQYRHEPTSLVARVVGYADSVENDYKVDVEVPDASGRLAPVKAPLFNNAYSAQAAALEVGVVEKPWAKRLILRGFLSASRKEIQHNQVMSVPYGEPWWQDESRGAALLYDQDFGAGVQLSTTTTYSYRRAHIEDLSGYVYNWLGERVSERIEPGEITDSPLDKTVWRHAIFHRSAAEWEMVPEHTLHASFTPLYSTQTGRDDRWAADYPDPLAAKNQILAIVSGLGYELNLVPMPGAPRERRLRRRGTDFRLQNTFHVKSYVYSIDTTEELQGTGGLRTHSDERHDLGVGDGVRVALTKWLFLKGSYEYARRLPDPVEIFGDGATIAANAELEPEVSHNANFGPLLDWKGTPAGDFVALVNLAYRDSTNMIVLLGNLQFQNYRNVYRAITWSGEGGLSWSSPGEFVNLDFSATLNDSRNRSESGPFEEYAGDKIPNRSPLGTSWAAELRFRNVFVRRDRLEPFYQGRYTEGFFIGWESQGITEYKAEVEDQTAHDAGITYVNEWSHVRLTNTFEVQNFADSALFDDFGVQRPGRAFYWKIGGDFY